MRIIVAKCPVGTSGSVSGALTDSNNPCAPKPPRVLADRATFVRENLPDNGPPRTTGESLTKTWRVNNTGTSTWDGFNLIFTGGNQMGGASPVNISKTEPGQEVEISVNLTAPDRSCRGNWQIVNKEGTWVEGGALRVQINIAGTAPVSDESIDIIKTDYPVTVNPGESFRPKITVRVNDSEGTLIESRGDMLLNKDGNLYGAHELVQVKGVVNPGQTYEFIFYENDPIKAPSQEGTYESRWQVWRNGSWIGPEVNIRFEVKAGGGSNRPPNAPKLTDPGDWAVFQSTPTLHAQSTGDPDGDAVNQFYFEIFESAETPNSGWTSSVAGHRLVLTITDFSGV